VNAADYAGLSLWHATAGDLTPRPALSADTEADVAIVGAGFTGLWTAYYLAKARPDLRITVLEKEIAGFGASGRNGGWCSALFPAEAATLAGWSTRDQAIAQHAAMRATVDEVILVASAEGIEADIAKGGTVMLARTVPQLARARADVADARSWGRGEDDIRLLTAGETRSMLNATGVLGGTYTPDCAAIHPAKLARGLARVVAGLGVTIYEQTPVTAIAAHSVSTPAGRVKADFVVRATEGYTVGLPGLERALVPFYSMIVATDPLPASVWDEIGLRERQTFGDFRHLIVYGQRTADDRLVFGGRGAPYHFGSSVKPEHDRSPAVHDAIRRSLIDLFPVLRDVAMPHAWGGVLGMPRDWAASVTLDQATGLATAGGYVGDGVSTTNLAGRTLRDLILGEQTELTALPWVGHQSPRWEREPLRWIGANLGLRAVALADREERLTGRQSLFRKAIAPLIGH
jgi:glycine/D-amino acid oxidase-like deaminating enzyme